MNENNTTSQKNTDTTNLNLTIEHLETTSITNIELIIEQLKILNEYQECITVQNSKILKKLDKIHSHTSFYTFIIWLIILSNLILLFIGLSAGINIYQNIFNLF